MKNGKAPERRSWASRMMVLMVLMAVLAGSAPVSALPPVDGGDDGGGDGGGGGGGGIPQDCLGETTASFWVSPPTVKVGEYTTLHWSVNPAPGCAGMTQSITTIGPVSRSGSQTVRIISPRSWGLHGQFLGGRRELASTAAAVEIPPTVTITSDDQVGLFLQAIAIPGQRIEIQNHVNLDLSYKDNLYIAAGVQIIGGRSSTEAGPRLFTTTFPQRLLNIGGGHDFDLSDNVRISGIRLQGAEMGSADADAPGSTGITIYSSQNVEIDNNELSGWRGSAVNVRDSLNLINLTNYDAVRVRNNYIHHNQHDRTEGYGVSLHESAYALIEKNVFNYNRHAIAAEGASLTGYDALSNLVFGQGGLGNSTFNIHTHMFDVHGSYSCYGFGHYCGNAGEKFLFRDNTILYDHGTAIKVRGEPAIGAWADRNVFKHPDQWGGYLDDAALVQNAPGHNFYATNNIFGAEFNDMLVRPACDFNGDGLLDDFLATGVTWWYYPDTLTGANRAWRYLNTSTKHRSELTLGDVNSDGICDVKDNNGVLYLGGVTKVPPPPPSLPLIPNVKGSTLAEASSKLTTAGFIRGTVTYVSNPTCDKIGLVTSQSPAAGTPAASGTSVKLSVGKAPSTLCF